MFRIFVVCTGNRCRSPMAEALLRFYGRDLPIEVGSVGLLDLGPVPVPSEILETGTALGLDLSAHRARAMANVDLSRADLVIGLEWGHVAAAVVDARVPHARAFTLVELVNLLEELEDRPSSRDPVSRAREMVARAQERRSSAGRVPVGIDIQDPFGGPRAGYADMAHKVQDLCRRLIDHLFYADARRRSG